MSYMSYIIILVEIWFGGGGWGFLEIDEFVIGLSHKNCSGEFGPKKCQFLIGNC